MHFAILTPPEKLNIAVNVVTSVKLNSLN